MPTVHSNYQIFCCRGKWPEDYWRRDFQEEYMPPITRENPGFSNYLLQNGFILKVIPFVTFPVYLSHC